MTTTDLSTETYQPTPAYWALVAALTTIKPDMFTGKIEQHQIVEVLGEIGGIWPASVLDDQAGIEIKAVAAQDRGGRNCGD